MRLCLFSCPISEHFLLDGIRLFAASSAASMQMLANILQLAKDSNGKHVNVQHPILSQPSATWSSAAPQTLKS